MTKVELGTKRTCPNCGTRYYDLNRSPIICPKCGTRFEVAAAGRARPQPAPKVVVPEPEPEVLPVAAELVSLEEADDEAADSGKVKVEGDEEEEEEAVIEGGGDDPFLEPEEEDGEDVGDIIGDVNEEER